MGTRRKRLRIILCVIVVLTVAVLLGAKYNSKKAVKTASKKVTAEKLNKKADAQIKKEVIEKKKEEMPEDKEKEELAKKAEEEEMNAPKDAGAEEVDKQEQSEINEEPEEPENVNVTVECILQNPELPTGCEATSGTMLLRAYGYQAEKMDVAEKMEKGKIIDKDGRRYAGHPDDVFIGNPTSTHGFGAFPNVLAKAMQKVIDEQNGAHRAVPMYGKSQQEILEIVDKGIPLCIWSSQGNVEIQALTGWYLMKDGKYLDEYFTWPSNEHVLVMTGYDDNSVFVCDPLKGERSFPRESFFRHYEQVGSYALMLEKE